MLPRVRRPNQDIIDALFNQVLDTFCAEGVSQEIAENVASLREPLLNPDVCTMAAKEFSLDEAVFAFGLEFTEGLVQVPIPGESLKWRIEDIPRRKTLYLLHSLLVNYSKNFDRSSKRVRKTALDFILNECLTVMKGIHLESEDQATDNHAQNTPTPWDDIKVFGEVSFSHTITRPANGKSVGTFLGTIVNGRVDRVIGRVLPLGRRGAMKHPKRRFQSLLLIVEAETACNLKGALPQLAVYLASLHQSRLQRNRSDATVYGVVSDGNAFIFVTITHDGVLKQSRRFEITQGDVLTVLGCLKYVLEMSVSMSPNLTLKENGGELVEDHSDYESDMDIDDNRYVSPSPE